MSTPDIKLLEGQALAAIESGDPADAQRFAQATGMAPDVFPGQLQAKGAGKVSEAIQAHLIASDQHLTKHDEKPFEIGQTPFTAVRTLVPRPHWLLRLDETMEVLESGAGGISNESVSKMKESVQKLLDRYSKGDVADFRRRFGLPETPPTKAVKADMAQPTWHTKGGIPRFKSKPEASEEPVLADSRGSAAPAAQTTLGLLERCIDLNQTLTVLDYTDIAAELMGELPKLIEVLHLADQVVAGMDTMLATYGDQLPAADLRSRTANVEGLRSLLDKLGVSAPAVETKLAPAESPSPGM